MSYIQTKASDPYLSALESTSSLAPPSEGFVNPTEGGSPPNILPVLHNLLQKCVKQQNTQIELLCKLTEKVTKLEQKVTRLESGKAPEITVTDSKIQELTEAISRLAVTPTGEKVTPKPKTPFYTFRNTKELYEAEKAKSKWKP